MIRCLLCNREPMRASADIADTFFRRLTGLLGKTHLPPDYCLILTPCSGIHMFFMKMPLDIAYLDSEGRVLALEPGLAPWRVGKAPRGTRTVLEAPVGGVLTRLCPGDQISWH